MKNTKCLFDEKQTPEGMISVSQLQTYLSCKKKWKYNYIDNVKPRVDRAYLTIGKLCHVGMQEAMNMMWQDVMWVCAMEEGVEAIKEEHSKYMAETPLLPEELPDFEQMLEDAISVFRQAFEEFEPWKYEVLTIYKDGLDIPALELHFKVPCRPTKGLHGYIDAILRDRETGFIWCTDYKFRKSLAPDDDEAYNIQNAVYAYACKKMGIDITGTMTWQHVNTPASDPAILKDGKISRSKIKTTWEHFANFCLQHNQNPSDYTEMIEKLGDIEWYRSTLEYRNDETIEKIWETCVLPVASDIAKARKPKAVNYPSLYPWNCRIGCQYQSICQAELRGYDVDAIMEREYVKRVR